MGAAHQSDDEPLRLVVGRIGKAHGVKGEATVEVRTDDPELRFATCLYAEVDPVSGVLEIARAGHPDPVIRMADATVLTRPTAGGLPLGIDPDADYPTTRIVLESGETMMICTDGLIETRDAPIDERLALLVRLVEETRGLSLEESCDRLLRRLRRPGAPDDVALLIARSTG